MDMTLVRLLCAIDDSIIVIKHHSISVSNKLRITVSGTKIANSVIKCKYYSKFDLIKYQYCILITITVKVLKVGIFINFSIISLNEYSIFKHNVVNFVFSRNRKY